jgi:hypothetical protein
LLTGKRVLGINKIGSMISPSEIVHAIRGAGSTIPPGDWTPAQSPVEAVGDPGRGGSPFDSAQGRERQPNRRTAPTEKAGV